MQHLTPKEKELLIKLNIEELTPVQVRLLKSLNSLLTSVVTAEDESEYFESSAALMKKAAELIKSSNFAKTNKNMNYADQAVEYAVDFLSEDSDKDNLDN